MTKIEIKTIWGDIIFTHEKENNTIKDTLQPAGTKAPSKTAKVKQGRRIETVEVNTKTFQVVQSRGVCNQNTPHHNEIINLVNANMNKIRQAI